MKVLVIGPSPVKSKGGMSTVIKDIVDDPNINNKHIIDAYPSYIDGNKVVVVLYSIFAFVRFYFTKRNYDIYHIHTASYGSTFRKGWYVDAAKKWGKKVVLHIHGGEYMNFFEKSNKKNRIVSILKSADLVIALSENWKKKFVRTFVLDNCVVLENGVDTDKLKVACISTKNIPHCVVLMGRICRGKGTYDMLDAIRMVKKRLPDIQCYLVGDGEIEYCKETISRKKLEENVIVAGWLDYNEKIEVLKKTKILALPSYNEALPMSILEGMGCGKVIISTTVGAIPEVVQKDNGILIFPGDVNGLADAIIKCCTDETYVETASKNNIKKIENTYSMKRMHERLMGYYESVMKRNKINDE